MYNHADVVATCRTRSQRHPHALPTAVTEDPIDADSWFVTGATAVGKTQIGLALAQRLGGEIISLDSMAVYRGMDIGTAKPSRTDRQLVAHHLLDILDADQEFSAAKYMRLARAAVDDIRGRGRIPVFVGGTPLYLKCLLRGLFVGPSANWPLRNAIEEELANVGQRALYDRLLQVDPLAASQIHPHDTRRLLRALEVQQATGEPISHQQVQFTTGRTADQVRVFVIRRPREELHQRIEERAERMIADGLVEEVRQLMAKPAGLSRTAAQAVGYREISAYLAGHIDLDAATENIKARTRRFAKRQETWFRSLSECRFIDICGETAADEVAAEIERAGRAPGATEGQPER